MCLQTVNEQIHIDIMTLRWSLLTPHDAISRHQKYVLQKVNDLNYVWL